MKRRPKSNPLSARIKRMMQADEDVGKIAGPTPVLIGRALEVFLKDLCEGASDVAIDRQARTLTPGHMKHYVNSTPHLDFLKDKFADVPDLPEQPAKGKPGASRPAAASKPVAAPKARKRQRVEEPAELPSGTERDHSRGMPSAEHPAPFVTTDHGLASQLEGVQVAAASLAAAPGMEGEAAGPGTAVGAPDAVQAQLATDQDLASMLSQGGVLPVMAHAESAAGAAIQQPVVHAPQAVAAEEDDYDAD